MGERVTPEETIAVLTSQSKEEDNFKIKINRKKGPLYEHLCTLVDASIQHVANPETWLPRLGGGGQYLMSVYHRNAPMPTGVGIPYHVTGPSIDVDPKIVQSKEWIGPPTMSFPDLVGERAEPPTITTVASGQHPASYTPPNTVSGQGANQMLPSTSAAESNAVQSNAFLTQMVNNLNAQIAALATQITMSAKDRQHELEMMKLNYERALAAKPAPDFGASLGPLITALAPVLTAVVQSGKESREASIRAQQEQAQQNMSMILALLNKPAVDPAFQSMVKDAIAEIKNSKQDNSPAAQTVATMSEAMQGMTSTALKLFHAAAEIGNGGQPREPPGLMVAKEVSKALVALGNGMAKAYPRPPPPPQQQQRQLPAPRRAPPAQQQAQQPPPPAPAPAPAEGFVDKLEAMIRRRTEPNLVADQIFANLGDSQLQEELAAHNGDINNLISARLGEWMAENGSNRDYLAGLFAAAQEEGIKRGFVDPASDQSDDEGEEEEEYEEDDGSEEESDDDSDGTEPAQE
jgi:hypothetical protein